MKMPKELYGELHEAIATNVISKYSPRGLTHHRRYVEFVKDQFIAYCWSIFHASGYDASKLYAAGLNDAHIETALKRILSDFE